jgi:hypothetical protein
MTSPARKRGAFCFNDVYRRLSVREFLTASVNVCTMAELCKEMWIEAHPTVRMAKMDFQKLIFGGIAHLSGVLTNLLFHQFAGTV